jgi:hypothetical protein
MGNMIGHIESIDFGDTSRLLLRSGCRNIAAYNGVAQIERHGKRRPAVSPLIRYCTSPHMFQEADR